LRQNFNEDGSVERTNENDANKAEGREDRSLAAGHRSIIGNYPLGFVLTPPAAERGGVI
jgi:hypothetical protein